MFFFWALINFWYRFDLWNTINSCQGDISTQSKSASKNELISIEVNTNVNKQTTHIKKMSLNFITLLQEKKLLSELEFIIQTE